MRGFFVSNRNQLCASASQVSESWGRNEVEQGKEETKFASNDGSRTPIGGDELC